MCGIAGMLRLRPDARAAPDTAAAMAAAIAHRGPDDQQTYTDPHGRCQLGFRRLAIIDLPGGAQPLSNETGDIWLLFNGEIYNFRTLRQSLVARGHTFRTNVDSEVIVHLYEDHGRDAFRHLHGMFAIALWDARSATLTLARDRFGQKPLVLAERDGWLYFASETKAILAALGNARPAVDLQALHEYLLLQYVPAPRHIYAGFAKLLPGHRATFAVDAPPNLVDQDAYYQLPAPGTYRGKYGDAKTELGDRLRRAVEKRLVADVPLGAFLSGGIDSSLIVALMRRCGAAPLRTFTIGFPDPRYDETAHARRVAEHFRTDHHAQQVRPETTALLDTLAYHYDEPFADSSAIPTFYLAQFTAQAVKVALTGDAGDEAFAGYDRYRAANLAARADWLPAAIRKRIASAAELLPHAHAKTTGRRLYRFLAALGRTPAERYLAWVSVFDRNALWNGYQWDFLERLDFNAPLNWFESYYRAVDAAPADRAMHVDFHSYLPYDLLTKVDVASMAVGLECRSPFLDHDVVDFARSLPLPWRLGRGDAGGKAILRDLARSLLPPEILRRPKMGFGVPIGEWFRGPLAAQLKAHVLSDHALGRQIFKPDWLEQRVHDHLSGRANHAHALWALLMLERWRERWNVSL